MGFSSWMTSEGQSIPNFYQRHRPTFTVWMVMPDGTKYKEDCYAGYGEFGGKDFEEAVAELNGHADTTEEEELHAGHVALRSKRRRTLLPRFTSDPSKGWEDLADPERCPHQGFFY